MKGKIFSGVLYSILCIQVLAKAVENPVSQTPVPTEVETTQRPVPTEAETTQTPVPTEVETTQPPVPTEVETTQTPVPTEVETTQPPVPTEVETTQTPVPTEVETTQRIPTPTRRTKEKRRNIWSCDFEDITCPVEQDGNLRWSRHTGATETWFTGPSNAAEGKYYMYMESSKCQKDYYAILYTPAMNDTGSVCVQFNYYMYGADVNKLELVTREAGVAPTSVWQEQGDHYEEWLMALVSVAIRKEMVIGLKATCGDGDLGDIGIDDLKVTSGECRVTPTTPMPSETPPKSTLVLWSCNFEEKGAEALCGAEQSDIDDFDWTVNEGRTPSKGTGPKSAAKGRKYIYIETSNRPDFNEARLLTPGLALNGEACLQLQYNMYGKWHMGTLEIILLTPNGQESAAWSQTGNQGHKWKKLRQTLQLEDGAKVVIRGEKKDGETGDIAVDDIWITPGKC